MLRSFTPAAAAPGRFKLKLPASSSNYADNIKPVLDRVAALLGLLILAPLLLIIALAIICTNGRPILFLQKRIGRHFQPFTIIKFRTMSADKITGIGGFLRQTGLDELPQLWNILIGDMSWIGPRPLTENDIQRLGWQQPYYRRRWRAKPGITGLAQLFGGVGRKVTWLCDRTYIGDTSLRMDAKILLASMLICVAGKRRVRRYVYQMRTNASTP